jgi:hypothetical protein
MREPKVSMPAREAIFIAAFGVVMIALGFWL